MIFDFSLTLSGVKSPSELMGLATEHAREQFEVLSQQIKELAELGQGATLATTEPSTPTRVSRSPKPRELNQFPIVRSPEFFTGLHSVVMVFVLRAEFGR
jgi:hypothetical protein